MTGTVIFDALLPWPVLWALAALTGLIVAFALWRGLPGWWLRALAGIALLTGLSNPALRQEERQPLSDIVIAVVDESASQTLSDRAAQTETALDDLRARIAARANTELRVVRVTDAPEDGGTKLMTALAEALSEEPQGRVAGVVMLTDGRLHDAARAPDLPAPAHVLLSGRETDWDRRLVVRNAPAFAILGEEIELTLRVEDSGAAPETGSTVPLTIAVDGGEPMRFEVPLGRDIALPVTLPHGGMNVLQFATPEAPGELTARNNESVVQINGVRDRLRVLLVSGEPMAGERTWRNLLKSDPSVDLVHFTILRPPEKQDGVPVEELSLIAFPTRELFIEKIDEFDLIVFDRYRRRGILPSDYFANVARYVEEGGAVLVTAGPEYAGADSIYRSPLGFVLPGAPSARVVERAFRPELTELGARHPVTSGLADPWIEADTDPLRPDWGRWFRQVEIEPTQSATVALAGPDDRPLLTLDRVGDGRVALLASDQVWLWGRGYDGGGPQLDLLRRLAHWMMKEPELEEEALWAEPSGLSMRIIRRSLSEEVGPATVTAPDGTETQVPLEEVEPGRFEARWTAPRMGLYRLAEGEQSAVIALGPAAPREFEQTIAGGEALETAVAATRGGIVSMEDGLPTLRDVRPGRPAAGRGWIGLTPRGAYRTLDLTVTPLLPAWVLLALAAGLMLGAWLREARR
ncbi:LOW QUALITY PROTEIN: threonine dehydrogenase and related Zn-dependent dehydrogenases [Limimaricola cinnabarinus LL-001]|uniref:Threonine dehydrogenase and related Zn-dependent dehydrogenases n=1 Tax=Limimaricola cinnabarinus LL-001 TaxID=1337093 RepID=U2Z1T3_9RHOB|nr:LOW QUALITY PROTEIN: threonine dehydrogenase and related Zn-dependent dehydrogenases [Limimaricola cinnabarinus LL-001]